MYIEIFKLTVVLILLFFVMNSFFILWFGKIFLALELLINKLKMKIKKESQEIEKFKELSIKSKEIKV